MTTTETPTLTDRQYNALQAERLVNDCKLASLARQFAEDNPDRVKGMDNLPQPEDVLCVDVTVTATVLLGFGGPSRGVDFSFRSGCFQSAEYWNTETGDPGRFGNAERIPLDDDEAEAIADACCGGIDSLAESVASLIGEQGFTR